MFDKVMNNGIAKFMKSKTLKCIKNTSILSLIFSFLLLLFFMLMLYLNNQYNIEDDYVWLIPLVFGVVLCFFFSMFLAFLVVVAFKEYILKETDFSMGLIDKIDNIFCKIKSKIIRWILITLSVITLLLFVIETVALCWIFIIIFVIIGFVWNFIYEKLSNIKCS